MLSLVLALAVSAEPAKAPPELGITSIGYGSRLVVDLQDRVEGRDYVRTGGVFRIDPSFLPRYRDGANRNITRPNPDIPEVRLIHRPAR